MNFKFDKIEVSKYYKVILLILLSLVVYYCSILSIDAHHDGYMFNVALSVSRGKVIFKEAATAYGPLSTFIQAIAIKLFGESVWSIRIVTGFFYILSYIMFFKVFKRFMPEKFLLFCETIMLLCAPFWLKTFHPWSSVFAIFFQLCAIWCIIRYMETKLNRFILFCGVMSTMGFLCRQTVGFVLVLAFILTEMVFIYTKIINIKMAIKQILYYVAGITIVLLPFLVYLCLAGALKEWWEQNIKFLFLFASQRSGGGENATVIARQATSGLVVESTNVTKVTNSSEIFDKVITMGWHIIRCLIPFRGEEFVWLALPLSNLMIFSLSAYQIIKNKIKKKEISSEIILLVIVSVFAVSSWHQYYPVAEIRHYYWGGFPMFGLLFFTGFKLAGIWYNEKQRNVIGVILITFVCFTAMYSHLSRFYCERLFKYTNTFEDSRYQYINGLKLSNEQLDFYSKVYAVVDELRMEYDGKDIFYDGFSLTILPICDNGNVDVRKSKEPIWIKSYNEMEGPEQIEGYFPYKIIKANFNTQEMEDWSDSLIVYCPDEAK